MFIIMIAVVIARNAVLFQLKESILLVMSSSSNFLEFIPCTPINHTITVLQLEIHSHPHIQSQTH